MCNKMFNHPRGLIYYSLLHRRNNTPRATIQQMQYANLTSPSTP